jgi:hypothetical protein
MPKTMKELLEEYVSTFTEKEKKAHEIASSHLGSSFNLEKSVGFIQWLKTVTITTTTTTTNA